jgi:hypothetical protein
LFAFNTTAILDEAAVDYLYGNQGQDWFWVFGSDKAHVKGNEINKELQPIAASSASL